MKMSPANLVQSFALTAERYSEVVQNLGTHVTKSERSTEEREHGPAKCSAATGQFSVETDAWERDSILSGGKIDYKLLTNQ